MIYYVYIFIIQFIFEDVSSQDIIRLTGPIMFSSVIKNFMIDKIASNSSSSSSSNGDSPETGVLLFPTEVFHSVPNNIIIDLGNSKE